MKHFTFTVQPYNQVVVAYYNYTTPVAKRCAKKYGCPVDDEGSMVYFADGVSEITVLIEQHIHKSNLVETVAHEAFHVVQWMCKAYGLSTEDWESCAYLIGYIVKKLYEGCK